jgi:cysteine desulfurase
MKKKIYLDNNATTQIDSDVIAAMQKEWSYGPSNPSSIHFWGRQAKQRLSKARKDIASFLQVHEEEILFTSGGSEGLSFLLQGLLEKGHIITSNIEHAAVYQNLLLLEERGFDISFLPSGPWGAVSPQDIEKHLRPDTKLIILSAANAETGVKVDWEAIAQIAERCRIPFFLDGVSLLGKDFFSIPRGVSSIAFSGHKFHGPPGIGFLFLRSPTKLKALIRGGHQEFHTRAGTENLPAIIGLAKAVCLLSQSSEWINHMRTLRDYFEQKMQTLFPNVSINGTGPRVSNVSNMLFSGIDGETALILLDQAGIAVSMGSACAAGSLEPSRVLLNMGLSRKEALSSIRFTLSRYTTIEEIDYCLEVLSAILSSQSDYAICFNNKV